MPPRGHPYKDIMSIIASDIQAGLTLACANLARGAGTDPHQRILLSPLDADRLELVCANGTTETTMTIKGQLESGIALAKQFADLVQTLANDVTIKLTPDAKGKCKVRTGRSQFTLPTIAPKDFPRFQAEEDDKAVAFTISASAMAKAINSASLGLSKPDPAKTFTGGVLLKATPDGVFLVATNSFKFVLVSVAGGTGEGGATIQGIIPEMGVAQIERLAKAQGGEGATLQFKMGPRQIAVSAGDASVRSRLIAGGYPDFEKVIRADAPVSLSVSQTALLAVLTRVGLFVTDKAPFVTLDLDAGRLACRTESTAGDSNEGLEVDAPEGAKGSISVNISYLASVLKAMPADKVDLDFGTLLLRVRGTGPTHNAIAVVARYNA